MKMAAGTTALLSLTALALFAPLGAGARQAAGGDAGSGPQNFAVLGSGHLVAATEALTNAEAHCAITATKGIAGMQCRSEGGKVNASYHYDTILVLDAQGTAYVIACRVSLLPLGCKALSSGTALQGKIDSGVLTADGDKSRRYLVLTSANVGAVTQPAPRAPKGGAAPARVEPAAAAVPATAKSQQSPVAAASPEKATGDSVANCASASGACVLFVSEPQGADIYVDGKFAGNTPSTLTLAPGSHELRVEAARFKPWKRTLETTAGSKVTIRATLDAQGPAN